MSTPVSLRERVSRELLPRVRHPAQYVGGEVNQLARPGDWESARLRVAIGFPDTYTIGMSHLGCQILYWLCNHTPGVCAERVFCPWIDAERVLRDRGIPLFTWDTRQPVSSADIFAISLQYEMSFTNVLNMLDLAGIPVLAGERRDEHPLVIVGGPQADNPEPMAMFVDLVVIGDGEDSFAAILGAVDELKRAGVGRRDMVVALARRFPWIYAPNLYEARYHADGTLAQLVPKVEGLPARIDRCRTADFENAPFPVAPIVPWMNVVHDRVGVEIMRGCPQVCRFCHAGYTKRPLKLRSVAQITELAERAWAATGQNEIGLLSLSSADYPHLRELAQRLNERFAPRHVNLSFPSLRVDRMLASIPEMSSAVRKAGLTIAVEAANDDMRQAIRKKVTDGRLLDGVRAAYEAGWRRVKLYFMSGFPGEREEDIDGIWRLSCQISDERRRLRLGPASVTASVGWLVPKPFTPMQWMAQPRIEYFRAVRERLRANAVGADPSRVSLRGLSAFGAGRPTVDHGWRDAGDEAPMEGRGAAARRVTDIDVPGELPRPGAFDGALLDAGEAAASVAAPSFDDAGRDGSDVVRLGRGGRGARSANRNVRITTHSPERSILEGVFARGDRRLGPVILEAWRRGARFDGWDETFRYSIWRDAYAATGVDPDFYAHRERRFDELLPWDHIGLHMRRGFLEEGYDDLYATIGVAKPDPDSPAGRSLPLMATR
ncbi:MAG: TIGR03960 family B12-binding radical SAM protein [Planctomycetia bacterium]|nr:MAG: TIGR03960 family B12-binding radical SAM protein [Planctomycetia bacterium]